MAVGQTGARPPWIYEGGRELNCTPPPWSNPRVLSRSPPVKSEMSSVRSFFADQQASAARRADAEAAGADDEATDCAENFGACDAVSTAGAAGSPKKKEKRRPAAPTCGSSLISGNSSQGPHVSELTRSSQVTSSFPETQPVA